MFMGNLLLRWMQQEVEKKPRRYGQPQTPPCELQQPRFDAQLKQEGDKVPTSPSTTPR
jgi:hypothetical protein